MTDGAGHAPTLRQLLVDISNIAQVDSRTGIQRVVRALWLGLCRSTPAGFVLRPVFATRERGYRLAPSDFLTRTITDPHGNFPSVEVRPGDIFLGLDLAPNLLPLHERQIAGWKRNGALIHFVIYDLLPLLGPRWFGWRARRNFRRWIKVVERQAHSAICISPSVARDFIRWTGRPTLFGAGRREVLATCIRLGSDIANSEPSQGLPENYAQILRWISERKTVLMVGTVEPRKGYDKALAAFEHLWRKGRQDVGLLIVGKPGWKTRRLQHKLRELALGPYPLCWIENASDQLLQTLYSASFGLLHAAHAEGLGLPLLEAALYRKPLLVRSLPVFKEIGLSGCTYFKNDEPEQLADTILSWTNAAPVCAESSNLPNWQDSADDLLDAIIHNTSVLD